MVLEFAILNVIFIRQVKKFKLVGFIYAPSNQCFDIWQAYEREKKIKKKK